MESSVLESATTDSLEQQLIEDERLIGRVRHRQLALIDELDRRQTATVDGCTTMVEWVASRIDVTRQTAAGLVGTARRLSDHPSLADDLAAGQVSFERAELVAKLGGSVDEYAHLDLGNLRRLVARRRHLTPVSERAVFEGRRINLQPSLDRSRIKVWGELPGLDGATVEAAVFAKADQFPPEARRTSRAARHADALVAICHDSLTTTGSETASRPGVTVFVDATTTGAAGGGAGGSSGAGYGAAGYPAAGYVAGGPTVGPNTLEELLCTGTTETIAIHKTGRPLGVGRRTAKIPPKLRRFVLGRDDGCTADGCASRYRLQPHHRTHWAQGGPTDADNLITLCWYHHHIVIHQQGHTIDPTSPQQRLRFKPPPHGHDPP